jgi:hypothetical protein
LCLKKSNKQATTPGQSSSTTTTSTSVDISKVFRQYDIKETSLHLHISTLNIHLYADDNYSGNKLIDGGAIQFLFKQLCIDHYPYHIYNNNNNNNSGSSSSSIRHWHNFNPTFRQKEEWSKSLINEFVNKLESIFNKTKLRHDLSKIKLKANTNLLEACTVFTLRDFCMYKVTTNLSTGKSKQQNGITMQQKTTTPNDTLKSETYFLDQQTFNHNQSQNKQQRAFISSNYAEFNLPSDTLLAQFFFSEFYFPDDQSCNYPLPAAQVFAQIAPIQINIDFLTLLWLNTLGFSLWREKLIVDQTDQSTHSQNKTSLKENIKLLETIKQQEQKKQAQTNSPTSTAHPTCKFLIFQLFFFYFRSKMLVL